MSEFSWADGSGKQEKRWFLHPAAVCESSVSETRWKEKATLLLIMDWKNVN